MTKRSQRPRVSVLLPVRDGAAYVGEAIASILAQTHDAFELVVIDDGSVDETPTILAGVADERLHILRNDTPLGLAASLNRGLAQARGDLVARLDADDIAEPTRLARQIAALDARPSVALLGSWYTKIDAHGRPLGRRKLPCTDTGLRWALLFHCPFVHSAVVFRTDVVRDRLGGYDERFVYSLDHELWTRIAATHEIANLPDYLVRLRVHGASMTAQIGPHLLEGIRLRTARVAALLGWSGDEDRLQARHAALTRLFLGAPTGAVPDDVDGAVHDLFALYERFVADENVTSGPAARLAGDLRRRVAHNLVDLSLDYQELRRPVDARVAIRHARRVQPLAAAQRSLTAKLRRARSRTESAARPSGTS